MALVAHLLPWRASAQGLASLGGQGAAADAGVAAADGGASTADAPKAAASSSSIPAAVAPDAARNAATPEAEKDVWGVGGHPIVGYGPESSWVLGAGAAFYYNSRPNDREQRPDEYGVNLTYSLRNHGSISLDATKYIGGNRSFADASLELTSSPRSFFGVGPRTPDSAEEAFDQRGIALTLAYNIMVLPGLYIGPEYDFFFSSITNAGPLLASGAIAGSGTTHESGIGLSVTYDTTNPKLYKLSGTRIGLLTDLHHSALGGSHTFGRTELSIRHYFPLRWGLVLALHGAFQTTYGDVPFFYLPSLGGNKLLRGYSSERYIANHFLGAQAELRVPLFWRFGAVAFLGAAEVESSFADFGSTLRAAGGLGFRIALNKKQTINLRFDFALNSDGEFEKYIKLREAF